MGLLTESRRKQKVKQPSSWHQIKNLLTCKQIQGSTVHHPSKIFNNPIAYPTLCRSICGFNDVVHGNTKVVHRSDYSPDSSTAGQHTGLLHRRKLVPDSSSSIHRSNGAGNYTSSSSRRMLLKKLSGCDYECHANKFAFSSRTTICSCYQCGEVFASIENMELHQAVRHAVSELGPEDSGRNIVEIIFKSSWLMKDTPVCKIERILKVHNTQRTIQRFEDCRDAVKARALASSRKNPRCAADGNELLRFHCTTLSCSLGGRGSSSLCGSGCGVCTIIRRGFQLGNNYEGVHTTASSGRAHDALPCSADGIARRAMLVCRVIAGRVRRVTDEEGGACGAYDSVAGYAGMYADLEELMVCNPKAILPCFVVIYKALES